MNRAVVLAFVTVAFFNNTFAQTTTQKANSKGKSAEQTAAKVTINPASLDFGDQVAKKASKPQRITLTNTGNSKLYINSVVIGGDHKDDFAITHDTCTGATIEANKSCVIDIAFAPKATERRKANVEITDNAVDSPQRVTLTGNGINSVDVPPRR